MKLYEFEGKRLFDRAGIPTPPGKVVAAVEEARGLTDSYGSVMVKAQVLWGRRGKAGAILACDNETQLADAVRSLLGRKLFDETIQKVLVEKKLDIAEEVYAAVTYVGISPTLIVSSRGGMDVEQAGQGSQEGVWTELIQLARGMQPQQVAGLVGRAGCFTNWTATSSSWPPAAARASRPSIICAF